MSEEKQYIDDQWDDLPLPDGDVAWQKMELLLDEGKSRRRVIPFWIWRSAGLGVLLLGLVVGGWLWLSGNKKERQTSSVPQEKTSKQKNKESTINQSKASPILESTIFRKDDVSHTSTDQPINERVTQPLVKKQEKTAANLISSRKKENKKQKAETSIVESYTTGIELTKEMPSEKMKNGGKLATPEQKENKIDSAKKSVTPKTDSTTSKDIIAQKAAEPVASSEQKKDSGPEKSGFIFSAGVGLQQAIAFAGQQSSTYHYKGGRNLASDHIPSVYVRVQRGKWFAQAEFQYAVPQPVKQFSFNQKTRYDVASLNLSTEQFFIQKLYYHHLPFSVNYHVLPNWSVGAGAIYSMLAGAVTEQEVRNKNVQTGSESTSRNITPVKGYKDSFLYKSTAGIIVQTDYHWKQFSLGLRFTQNLQPFMKYTTPNGEIIDERNKALQAILRFRLFER